MSIAGSSLHELHVNRYANVSAALGMYAEVQNCRANLIWTPGISSTQSVLEFWELGESPRKTNPNGLPTTSTSVSQHPFCTQRTWSNLQCMYLLQSD
jgi:hypothetical protein